MSNNINEGTGEQLPAWRCESYTFYYPLLPHDDDTKCVGWAVRYLVFHINNREWSSDAARAEGLRKLVVAQLGSDKLDQFRFAHLVALKTVQRMCPLLFAQLAKLAETDEDREAMESAGRACAEVASLQDAVMVLTLGLGRASGAAHTLEIARYSALALANGHTIAHALDLALFLALTLDHVHAIDRDETLAMLADICVEVLVEMESHGCQWLELCEGGSCCKVCGSEMRDGVTLVNGVCSSEDFAGDLSSDGVTMSECPSDGSLVPCIKCIECGHSFIP